MPELDRDVVQVRSRIEDYLRAITETTSLHFAQQAALRALDEIQALKGPPGSTFCTVCAYVPQIKPCKLCGRPTSPEREELEAGKKVTLPWEPLEGPLQPR